jgi:hypothetical protein
MKIGSPARQDEGRIEQTLAAAKSRLSAEAYDQAWRDGRSMDLDRLLAQGSTGA